MFSYKICFLRVKNLEPIKNLKIYDPDQEQSFTKTKFARRPRDVEQREKWGNRECCGKPLPELFHR